MAFDKIESDNGTLNVPDRVTLPYIIGDGIGKDLTEPILETLDEAIEAAYDEQKEVQWKELLAGKKAKNKTDKHLPEETVESFKEHKVGIKGPLRTPVGKGFRSLNVKLRQALDLFVCLRPVKWFEGIDTPVKNPEDVEFHIFRENTEDIYAGIEYELGTPENGKILNFLQDEMEAENIRFPDTTAIGIKPISRQGSKRLIGASIEYAIDNNLPYVTLVHKGNIMKFTEGAFKKWGYDMAEEKYSDQVFTEREYNRIVDEKGKSEADKVWNEAKNSGKVIVKDVIADAFFQAMLLRPEQHSVIATMNLNGDYVSDMAAAMVGGIGIAPGGNINYNTGNAIFEATHGTAPDIAGTGKANPCSLLLSGSKMLRYIGWEEAADLINVSVDKQLKTGRVTPDLYNKMEKQGKELTTKEFINDIIKKLRSEG